MKKIANNLYLFESKTNVLLYKIGKYCYLIDSGKSSSLKNEILDFLATNNLILKAVINTHSHSDHIINDDISPKIYASETERTIIENANLQLDFLFGAKHPKFFETLFFASPSFKADKLEEIENIEYIDLKGHSYNMIGVCIENKFIYIGDALFSENELKGIPYIYDVENFLESVKKLEKYNSMVVISSHIGVIDNLFNVINANLKFIEEMKNDILEISKKPHRFDEILEYLCEKKNISLNNINYYLIASTIKAFISYLIDSDLIELKFEKCNLYYVSK